MGGSSILASQFWLVAELLRRLTMSAYLHVALSAVFVARRCAVILN